MDTQEEARERLRRNGSETEFLAGRRSERAATRDAERLHSGEPLSQEMRRRERVRRIGTDSLH